MTYASIKDLPKSVQNTLPVHAQELYLMAFNCAHEEHRLDQECSEKFAWEAVQKHYKKENDQWINKQLSH